MGKGRLQEVDESLGTSAGGHCFLGGLLGWYADWFWRVALPTLLCWAAVRVWFRGRPVQLRRCEGDKEREGVKRAACIITGAGETVEV
jgi:hypothetical protein